MRALLDALGRPQLAYRTIHIAGSKGKGTTAWLIDAILRACGVSTGRFTSPISSVGMSALPLTASLSPTNRLPVCCETSST